jgi:hypothetical protein
VCGSDGCGGSCGTPCPTDQECYNGTKCICAVTSRVTYTFTANSINFTQQSGVPWIPAVEIQWLTQTDLDGTSILQWGRPKDPILDSTHASSSLTLFGCTHNLSFKRHYNVVGADGVTIFTCDSSVETLTSASYDVPAPIIDAVANTCSAP